MEKLQRFLARSGVASRRASAGVIEAGRVTVDGQPARDVTAVIDPERADVRVDGHKVQPEQKVYYMLNKPAGYVCTSRAEHGEKTALSLVADDARRLYTVGRLDKESEGLILVTNDGDLANVLTHPRFKVAKTYYVEVLGRIEPAHCEKLRHGMWIDGRKTAAARVRIRNRGRVRSKFDITIAEGLNRQVRRMLARVGLKVRKLRRIAIGQIVLRGAGRGKARKLTGKELHYLRGLVESFGLDPSGEGKKGK